MTRLTEAMLRHRWAVLGVWLVIFLAAGWASSQLSDLLTNRFALPGTDAEKAARKSVYVEYRDTSYSQ